MTMDWVQKRFLMVKKKKKKMCEKRLDTWPFMYKDAWTFLLLLPFKWRRILNVTGSHFLPGVVLRVGCYSVQTAANSSVPLKTLACFSSYEHSLVFVR